MKTKEEILKDKGITELTAFHAYPYLYRATIEAMDLYAQQQTEELRKENEELRKAILKTKEIHRLIGLHPKIEDWPS